MERSKTKNISFSFPSPLFRLRAICATFFPWRLSLRVCPPDSPNDKGAGQNQTLPFLSLYASLPALAYVCSHMPRPLCFSPKSPPSCLRRSLDGKTHHDSRQKSRPIPTRSLRPNLKKKRTSSPAISPASSSLGFSRVPKPLIPRWNYPPPPLRKTRLFLFVPPKLDFKKNMGPPQMKP